MTNRQKKKIWHSAFVEAIFHEKVGGSAKGRFDVDFEEGDFQYVKHLTFYKLAVFLIALIFIGRLFQLTVVFGSQNRELSESNRIKLVEVPAVRGEILDRGGQRLVFSSEIFELKKGEKLANISKEQVGDLVKLGLASEDFEGELGKIEREVNRQYSLGEAASHVLGYISAFQGSAQEVKSGYLSGDLIGRAGLEASYENFLRGKIGKKLVEVDAIGRNIAILGEEAAENGVNIRTTIDGDLQKKAFEALKVQAEKVKSFRGAVVAQDPKNGAVLALASVPGYDPLDVGRFVSDDNKPFFNRAVQGSYPPGSVFKVVSAFAGLETGKMTRDTEIEDVGEFTLGGVKFTNWFYNSYGGRDGNVNLEKAIARSNDIYFYRLAERVGLEGMRKMALKLGFGQKTGVDLPDEAFGLVPDEVWKKSALNEPWFLGDTLHLGIGQGFMLATPIQINNLASYMAGGKLFRPYLVSEIGEGEGQIRVNPKLIGENLVKEESFEAVRSGMRMACVRGGTAFPFFDAPYAVGCKTGTAEQAVGNPNAWFAVFAPYDNPEIALTVLIEDGGEGSTVAAPVAREILDWWFGRR